MNWQALGLNAINAIVANALMGTIGAYVRGQSLDKLQGFLVQFGQAFGPDKLGRHWSELTVAEQQAWYKKLPFLRGTHDDFVKGFQWIPRTLLFWEGDAPDWHDVRGGNATELRPIPNHGETLVLRGYRANTSAEGVHDREGFRWDDVDGYYELSISLKGVK